MADIESRMQMSTACASVTQTHAALERNRTGASRQSHESNRLIHEKRGRDKALGLGEHILIGTQYCGILTNSLPELLCL